jgi:hypothetical protein
LVWSDALSAITYYERVRAGRPPRFRIALRAEACYLLNHQTQWLRSAPAEIAGDAEVGYPTHAWIAMLRDMKVAENVLVEVPLPGTPPIGWEAIWEALIEARERSHELARRWLRADGHKVNGTIDAVAD